MFFACWAFTPKMASSHRMSGKIVNSSLKANFIMSERMKALCSESCGNRMTPFFAYGYKVFDLHSETSR
jgi:hypothetical protein